MRVLRWSVSITTVLWAVFALGAIADGESSRSGRNSVTPRHAATVIEPESAPQDTDSAAPATPQLIRELALQLAHDDFSRREHARLRLLQIGPRSLPILGEYHEATDNELRLSALRLSSQIRRQSNERAVARFLAGESGLPGWELFRKSISDTRQARQSYADIYRARPAELNQLDDPGQDRDQLLDQWLTAWSYSQDRQVQLDKFLWAVISILVTDRFDAGHRPAVAVPVQLQIRLGQAMTHPGIRQLLDDREFGPVYRWAIVAWVTHEDPSPVVLPLKISVASALRLREGLDSAIRCLDMEDIPGAHRRTAITLIARLGDVRHVPVLEQQLDDTLVVYRGNRRGPEGRMLTYTTQMGDVALSALIHLTGQKYSDYGMHLNRPDLRHLPLPFNLAGFPTPAARQAAHEQWTRFRQNTPQDIADPPDRTPNR